MDVKEQEVMSHSADAALETEDIVCASKMDPKCMPIMLSTFMDTNGMITLTKHSTTVSLEKSLRGQTLAYIKTLITLEH